MPGPLGGSMRRHFLALATLASIACATPILSSRDLERLPQRSLDDCTLRPDFNSMRSFEIVMILDASALAADATGYDVNMNGYLGKPRYFNSRSERVAKTPVPSPSG